jgi:hypothetical protein
MLKNILDFIVLLLGSRFFKKFKTTLPLVVGDKSKFFNDFISNLFCIKVFKLFGNPFEGASILFTLKTRPTG